MKFSADKLLLNIKEAVNTQPEPGAFLPEPFSQSYDSAARGRLARRTRGGGSIATACASEIRPPAAAFLREAFQGEAEAERQLSKATLCLRLWRITSAGLFGGIGTTVSVISPLQIWPLAYLPPRYCPRTTCYNRFVRWRGAGVWNRASLQWSMFAAVIPII